MRTYHLTAIPVLLLLVSSALAQDALDEALSSVGLARGDLGWERRAHWRRYPGDIPYLLRHTEGLLSEPIATVRYARSFGAEAARWLAPEALAAPGQRGNGALYHLVHAIGVGPRFGGFRAYSPNLTAGPTPLVEALLAVHAAAGRPTRYHTFGVDADYPKLREDLERQVAAVPEAVRPILGRLVLDAIEVERWASLAFRRVPLEDRVAVARRLDVTVEQVDALNYEPAADDVAVAWDEASLWYAGLKAVEALDRARRDLAALGPFEAPFALDHRTPRGWIRIRGGGDDAIDGDDAILVVDLGGDDAYRGRIAASSAERPVGLALDLAGNDSYGSGDAAQGCGLCGIGVLLDAAGDDVYAGGAMVQGVGQFGLGALLDLGGDDRYEARVGAQGAGVFGIGVLADAAGNDRYRIEGDGEGLGGAAGIGALADGAGDDVYVAVRDPAVTGRPSYHSEGRVSVSNAQGVGMGRRGDGADGHSWAGGLGLLLDVAGSDRYEAGNWSMGTGYWFGTGLLWDGGGDDRYAGVVWSQGSGAHFAIGALVDEAGDDHHVLEAGGRSGLAFGHDFTVALLVDATGSDRYACEGDGLGFSIHRSVAMLLDLAGDDAYEHPEGIRPGMSRFADTMAQRTGPSTYFADATSLGLFLDVGGSDRYADGRAGNEVWLDPPDHENRRVRNYSIGVDRAAGEVDLEPRPERAPSRKE